jgi:predicted lipoprotein with Yx(FWY)xxD motif
VSTRSTYLKAALAASALVVVAACGNSNSNSAGGSGGGAGGSTTSPGPNGKVVVETHTGPLGTYLTDSSGRTLYMFASDTSTASSCIGQCLTYWPALTTTAAASDEVSGGASAAMLGTISSGGASKQVTYAGHPLYYFFEDANPGDTLGQGSTNFGAKWWILAPSGKPITSAVGSRTTTSGGSYGY